MKKYYIGYTYISNGNTTIGQCQITNHSVDIPLFIDFIKSYRSGTKCPLDIVITSIYSEEVNTSREKDMRVDSGFIVLLGLIVIAHIIPKEMVNTSIGYWVFLSRIVMLLFLISRMDGKSLFFKCFYMEEKCISLSEKDFKTLVEGGTVEKEGRYL